MKYKLGEFVRFVDEKREGYITRIISDDMIGVTGDDDFEIPVLVSKVTRVHGHVYEDTPDTNIAKPADTADSFETKGIFLAVVPDPRKGSIVHFHIVNTTSFQLLSSLTTEQGKTLKGEFAGILSPRSALKVFTASLPDLSTWPVFHLQIMYFSSGNVSLPSPLIIKEKFKAKDFAGAKKLVSLLKQEGWLLRLDEEEVIIDPEKLKESFFKPVEEKKEIGKPLREVDLHIEVLHEHPEGLSKSEMLRIQLEHFKKALDAAIVHKLPSVIFIHGVGNGTLRTEIHKRLGRHPQVKTFMDARKEKFGYGATEALLK